VGAVAGPLKPLLVTVRHERIPRELRGRVVGAYSAAAQSVAPLGMVVAGSAIQSRGLNTTLVAMAIIWEVPAVGTLFVPPFRDMSSTGLPASPRR